MSFYKFENSIPNIDVLVDIIGRHEGFREKKYKDTKGIWTIGYGFNMESKTFPDELVKKWEKNGITKAEADTILKEHIESIIKALKKMQPWIFQLSTARQAAIIDLTFNMGPGWFSMFSNTILLIKSSRFKSAGTALLNSRYAKQVGLRARENAYALVNDTYPVPFTEHSITV